MATLPETEVDHADKFPDDNAEDDDDDGEIDPRIQKELDALNFASTEINCLENELDEARTKYRSIVSITSNQMEAIGHDRKKSIHKAREYYRLLTNSKLAQREALKAARQYQSAVGVYKAAKETVALAETNLCEDTSHATATLSSAWQETLNHAVERVMAAEKEKAQREEDHKRRAAKFAELETRKQGLEKKFSRSIKKARPYFELKAELDVKLMQQKQNVTDLQAAIKASKHRYTASLRRLETISEEIHQNRRQRLWSKIPRMPGVGADTDSDASGLSELDRCSLAESYDDNGDLSDDENETCSADVTFNIGMTSLGDASGQLNNDVIGSDEQSTSEKANVQAYNNRIKDDTNNDLSEKDNAVPKPSKEEGMITNSGTNVIPGMTPVIDTAKQTLENELTTLSQQKSFKEKTTSQSRSVSDSGENVTNTNNNDNDTKTTTDDFDKKLNSAEIDQESIENVDASHPCGKSNKIGNDGDIRTNTANNQSCSSPFKRVFTECKTIPVDSGEVTAEEEDASDYSGVDMATVERPLPSGQE